jgi:hypothetical protein
MSQPSLINEVEARTRIDQIRDPETKAVVGELLESAFRFYHEDPSQLRGDFDLVFFVNLLNEQISDIMGLIRGAVPVEYWFGVPPSPVEVSEGEDLGPNGIRPRLAFNYVATCGEPRIQAALFGLITRANWKQATFLSNIKKHKYYGPNPPVSEKPEAPFDFLFMVTAVAHSLEPGMAARRLIEASSHGL